MHWGPVSAGHVDAVDALIVGGGASGLSLACHLAASGWARTHRVLVVDDGARPIGERAWAYWSRGTGLLDPYASTTAHHLWVRAPGLARRLDLGPYRYLGLTGPDLARAVERLTAPARVERRTGTVTAVTGTASGALVTIRDASGEATVRARWVFDGVGIGAAPPHPAAHLRFLGLRVETARPAFDASAPTLMDFRTDQSAGLAFVYVLPGSPTSALVEHTLFDVGPGSSDDDGPDPRGAVERYLRTCLGVAEHRLTGAEQGSIPLVTAPPQTSRATSVVPVGTPAGMVKASTGYGFERIQRHSAALAASLTRHGHPWDVSPPSAWHRSLDALVLDVVRHEPAAARRVLTRMLTRNRPARSLAFLDEDTSRPEELALILTLPPSPFLRALTRRARRRARPGARHAG